MAIVQHAYITVQGDVNSRKMYDPSGYVVMSPRGFKNFRNSDPSKHDGLKAAVLWAVKKGYTVHLVKPEAKTSGRAALNAIMDVRLNEAIQYAQATIEAAKAEKEVEDDVYLPGHQVLKVGAKVHNHSTYTL